MRFLSGIASHQFEERTTAMRRLKALFFLGWVLIPGYWTLSGPEKVTCYEGESLSLQCHYETSFKNNTKFWCKGSILSLCSSLIIKSSSEGFVQKDRFSIRDSKEEGYFEITMDKLKHEDSGSYQCGIEKRLLDDRHYIQVTVSPDAKKPSATSAATPASAEFKNRELYILKYCMIPLILLLISAAVVLLIISRKKKGLGWKKKKERMLECTVRAQNAADAGREQSIPHHQLGSDGTGLYSIVEVHPENNYEEFPSQEKSPGNGDNPVYATLDISDPQHEFIYANTDFVPSPVFTKSQEDFSREVTNRSTKQ